MNKLQKIIIVLLSTIILILSGVIFIELKEKRQIEEANKKDFIFIGQLLKGIINNYNIEKNIENIYFNKEKIKTDGLIQEYIIFMSIADIYNHLERNSEECNEDYQLRLNQLIEINNVPDLEYKIFFCDKNFQELPEFPERTEFCKQYNNFSNFIIGDTLISKDATWRLIYKNNLKLDSSRTYKNFKKNKYNFFKSIPEYYSNFQVIAKNETVSQNFNSMLTYSHVLTKYYLNKNIEFKNNRVFKLKFSPFCGAGWYYIKIDSKTNRTAHLKPFIDDNVIHLGSIVIDKKLIQRYLDELYNELKKYKILNYKIMNFEYPCFCSCDESKGKINFRKSIKNAKKEIKSSEEIEKIQLYNFLSFHLFSGYINHWCASGDVDLFIRVNIEN